MLSPDERSLSSSSVGGDSEADLSVATMMLAEYNTAMGTNTTTDVDETGHDWLGGVNDDDDDDDDDKDRSSHLLPVHDSAAAVPSTGNEPIDDMQDDNTVITSHIGQADNLDGERGSDTSIKSGVIYQDANQSANGSYDGNNDNAVNSKDGSSNQNDSNKDATAGDDDNDNDDKDSNDKDDSKENEKDEEDDGGDKESWWRVILIGIAAGLYGLFSLVKKCCCGNEEVMEVPEPPG